MPRIVPWCFGAGVVLFHVLPCTPAFGWTLSLVLVALIGLRVRALRWMLACLLGFAWIWLRVEMRIAERWPAAPTSRTVVVEGVVSAPAKASGSTLQCILDIERVDGDARSLRARIAWYEPTAIPQPGERWRLHARLRAPRGFANPGGFDYEGWLFREGIGATGYVVADAGNVRISTASGRYGLLRMRMEIARRLEAITGASAHAGIVTALAVGLTEGLSEHDWEVLRATGTSHLISISGLHIALVAGGVAWLVRRGWGRVPGLLLRIAPIDAAALSGLVAAVLYALLAGFAIPTLRALIMLAVVLGRTALRRAGPGEAPLAQAFAAVLLVDPFAPLFPGFWLSFLAVAALMVGLLGGVRGLAAQLRTQWAVTLLAAPVTLAIFQSLSLIAPLINLLLIPVYSFVVVPPVLLAVPLLGPSDRIAALPLSLAVGAIDLTWPWLERAAALPAALWAAGARPLWVLAAAQLGLLLVAAPRGLPQRWLALPLLLPLVAWRPGTPATGAYELAVLDVGQGLAVVVRTERHTLLYDTGPSFRRGGDAGRLAVAPFLVERGVRVLDAMIVSHDDNDHSGGALSVAEAVPVTQRITGGRGEGEPCIAGRRWRWDGVDFEILHPRRGQQWSDNDGSCVLRVSGAGGSALLTGDIEQSAEGALIESAATLASDIVVAPHHGSDSSSSAALVALTHPRYVVFAAGFDNRWGFPRPAVLARWRAAGARALSTAAAGAVIFQVDPRRGVLPPWQQRRDGRHYWTAS
jgi:competence protein ComEC